MSSLPTLNGSITTPTVYQTSSSLVGDSIMLKPQSSDVRSTFSNDEGRPFTFSLTKLEALVSQQLGQPCYLRKLAEGGHHKVYDIIIKGEQGVKSVVRIASPEFPREKLESEVATLKYIAENTSVRVPKVLAWNSDCSNAVEAEFMILEKIGGVPAHSVWRTLCQEAKETFVRQVAKSLLALFRLRFSQAGSLYLGNNASFVVGPVVAPPFFQVIDGERRFPSSDPLDLSRFQGPFDRASDYLSHLVQVESYVVKQRRDIILEQLNGDEVHLTLAERILDKAACLAKVYPGDIPVGLDPSISDTKKPFSLRLDDFRQSNIMIDPQSGNITGFIDFETTSISPLWMCADHPWWLNEPEHDTVQEKEMLKHLKGVFDEAMRDQGREGLEWLAAAEQGEHFRYFSNKLVLPINRWAFKREEKWVDTRLVFAQQSPGTGLRELNDYEKREDRQEAHKRGEWVVVKNGFKYVDYRGLKFLISNCWCRKFVIISYCTNDTPSDGKMAGYCSKETQDWKTCGSLNAQFA